MSWDIPFNQPFVAGAEPDYMLQAVRNLHLSGSGPFTAKVQALLEKELGAAKVLLTTSCTHALEMSALLLDLKPGDEVLVPSFTFVSTLNAFVLRGAKPIFIDIRPDTLNLDEKQVEKLANEKTKAIVPVHYAGVGCQMDEIMAVANRLNVPVIEDNAHGLFGRFQHKNLGSFGAMSTLSFHETKNFTCGEGGALVLNDAKYIERAEIIREKGTNRTRFFRGQVDKYTWVDIGSSYPPSDMLAAFLLAQLEQKERIQTRRQQIWNRYHQALEPWAKRHGARMPIVPGDAQQAFHMFYLLLPNLNQRQKLIAHLKEKKIVAVFHYLPLHSSEMGLKLGGHAGQCPVTERVSDQLLRLPFFNAMTDQIQDRVIEAILAFNP